MPHADPEEKRAYDRAYNAAHREEKRAYDAAHREEKRAYNAAYYDREFTRLTGRIYAEEETKFGGKCHRPSCPNRANGRRLCRDHDHRCPACGGEKGCSQCYAGLLCAPCNLHAAAQDRLGLDIVRELMEYRRPTTQRLAEFANGESE